MLPSDRPRRQDSPLGGTPSATAELERASAPAAATAVRRWRHLKALFQAALEKTPEERAAWLAEIYRAQPELRQPLESLLASHEGAGDFLAPPPRDEPPEVFDVGPYRTLERIGEGGMGVVYRARRADDEFSKVVCVKVIRQGGEVARRLRAERQILARLEHPNIARLIDGGTTAEGLPYLVMEYVEGEPIDRYCDRRRLTVEARLELFRAVCAAVQHAHRHLIVHRDLKPSNILVTTDGVPKLLDFGIAKVLDPAPADDPASGWWAMTPEFASPEQLAGEAITTASDVYSLGVLLFSLLTGRHPYGRPGRSPWSLAQRLQEDGAPPLRRALAAGDFRGPTATEVAHRRGLAPRRLARRLAGDLEVLVGRTLQADPRQRYGSPQALSEDLRRHLCGEPIAARPATFFYRLGKRIRRSPFATVAAVVALLLAVGVGFFGLRAEHQRQQAHQARERAEALSAFLVELFEGSDPTKRQGRELDPRDILDRGAAAVAPHLAAMPAEEGRFRDQIGRIYLHLGDYDRARAMLEGALEAHRRVSSEATAATLSRLADLELRSGDTRRALDLARQSLALFEESLGSDHPEAVTALANLGSTLFASGYLDQAEPLLIAALERQPADGPGAATTRTNLGHLAILRGDWQTAESHLRPASEALRRQLGRRDPRTLDALSRLAVTRHRLGQRQRAERLLRQTLEAQIEVFGDPHPEVTASRSNLGLLLRERGRHAEAESLLRQAMGQTVAHFGESHPRSVMARTALATVILEAGRSAEARPLLRRAVEDGREAFAAGDPSLSHPLMGWGRVLLASEPPQAEDAFAEALELRRESWGEDHWRTVEAGGLLAVSRWRQGEVGAGGEIRSAADDLTDRLGARHPAARELRGAAAAAGE